MKKLSLITLALLAFAVAASAASVTTNKHQCTPEPITMLALIPGVAMFIRKRKQA
ncbi:MAG TPA: hypothetical protein VGL56_15800 [Fimbriimonadaceae bacterium]|jgi:hypothetical protein